MGRPFGYGRVKPGPEESRRDDRPTTQVQHERPPTGSVRCVSTREQLERLSSAELHDRAVDLAKSRHDLVWLWRLMRMIPAAEASIGDREEADMDIASTVTVIHDYVHAGEGALADALRPMYLEYLLEHGD